VERTIAGRYVLRGPLGTGGMADVFVADDLRLHRQVAVKLVPAAAITPTVRARFVREARTAARIVHPNAVVVYDAGESEGYLYLVMERVFGHTLGERLAATGPLPVQEAAQVAIAVLGALGAAHAAGVIHRDVKPANIIVGPGGVKLVDFGIATLLDEAGSTVTAAGELVGTPKYLAPEQISGGPATPATDVYAVGVVLFEMLTGAPPFDRSTPVATALAHREETPPDVRTLRSDASPRVAAVVTTALQKDPADRYQSAAEMQRALAPVASADYAADTAVLAAPTMSAGPRSSTRTAWWITAAVLAAVAAIVAAVIVLNDDDDGSGAPTTSAAGASATAAPTTAASTTTTAVPTTTTPPTTTTLPAPAAPQAPEQLIAVFAADPVRYGPRTGEVIDRLGEIDNRGRRSRERAAQLLEESAGWVDNGELTAEAYALLEPVLAPLADQGNGNGNDEGEDGDGDDD
jgi:serine/threonine-protein kinase